MIDIINWLAGVEEGASSFYAEAATVFAENKAFSAFLSLLAEEEADHLELLKESAGRMAQEEMAEGCFSLDEAIRRDVEAPFVRARQLLKEGELSEEAMVGMIAEAEFSEWNEIFLYVINTLKGHGREFQKAVAEIDQHRMDIEKFVSSFPWGDSLLQKIGRLRPLWKRRILVVEDDPAIANLLKALFRADAEVVLAEDGEEGLARIREGHFNVVVTDVEMPKVNGIEVYKQALAVDPNLKKCFVFFTGTRKPEHHTFFKSSNVIMLPKPSPLSRLRKVINEVADAVA